MISQVNRLGKELLLVGIGQAVAAVGSVVGVRLMTGAVSPAVYGEIALAITFVTLSQQLLLGPLSASLTRYFNFAQEKRQLSGFLGSSGSLVIKISLAMVAFCLLGALYLGISGRSAYLGLAAATLVFALVSGYNVLLDSIQTAARQRAVVAWHQGIGQWLRYLAAVGFVLWLGNSPSFAMIGYALSAVLIFGSQSFFFRRKISAGPIANITSNAEWTSRILDYSIPFATWGLFTWLQLTSDRWALQTFRSVQDVGFYTVLYQLGYYPLMMATTVFVQFAEPVLFRQAGDGTEMDRLNRAQKNTHHLLGGAVVLTALAGLAALLLHRFVFNIFAAPEYRSVSYLLPVIVLSGGLFACGQIASMKQLNRGESKALQQPKIVMAVLGTLLNIGGAYWLGITGVVFAGVLFSALFLIWILLLGSRSPKPTYAQN